MKRLPVKAAFFVLMGERSELLNFLRKDADAMEAWKDSL
jgi:hypothetical protein